MGIGIGLGLGLGTPARCDRQEAARPGGQGGPAAPEPAAVQKRITPARARGRLAARHSEALLQGSGAGARSTPRPLAAAACRGENSSTREPATLEKYVHPQLTRKVSEGLLRFHGGCAQKRAHRDHAESSPAVARHPHGVRKFGARSRVTHFLTVLTPAPPHLPTPPRHPTPSRHSWLTNL